MASANLFGRTKGYLMNCLGVSGSSACKSLNYYNEMSIRGYAKKRKDDGCRKAIVDMPKPVDPECPRGCLINRKKKPGILRRISMKIVEGGTNFGTPFRRLDCKEYPVCVKEKPKAVVKAQKALPAPKKESPPVPEPRPGVQVSVLGADTAVGQYVSFLLKQCSCVKKLRLFEAKDTQCAPCSRNLANVVEDLKTIDTNCLVQAFSNKGNDLEFCLQNTDIVLMLESSYVSPEMPLQKRFDFQAPIVKRYADSIAQECPRAFIIVCTSPIDCMVPLIAETMKETGWYDPRKVLGSLAVPEMRASTLAARALCLEPRYTRVPCVGGTEGESLVPLFSKAVQDFDFARHNAQMMTDAVRAANQYLSREESNCKKVADLSEAHAITGLVTTVAHALLCHDIPRVTGYVETDASQVISPVKYIANEVEINGSGIVRNLGLPKLTDLELTSVNLALIDLTQRLCMVKDWHLKYLSSTKRLDAYKFHFFTPKNYPRCLSIDVLLNRHGICKKFDFPPMNDLEVDMLSTALQHLEHNVTMARQWCVMAREQSIASQDMRMHKTFLLPKEYERLHDCGFCQVPS